MFTPGNTMIVLVILLLMFGAKKLPELARGLGQAMKEFSKAKSDIQDEIMRDPAPTSQTVHHAPQPPAHLEAPVVQAHPGTQAQGAPIASAPVPPAQPEPAKQA